MLGRAAVTHQLIHRGLQSRAPLQCLKHVHWSGWDLRDFAAVSALSSDACTGDWTRARIRTGEAAEMISGIDTSIGYRVSRGARL